MTGSDGDRITLTGLRVRGRHGVLAAERELGQEFVVDATVWLSLAAAAGSDDVLATVHYGELAEQLAAVVAGEPVDLIETLACRLVDVCLTDARVIRAEITVHKPAAPIPLAFDDVAVTVSRSRGPAVLALGSNLGDRFEYLQSAVTLLDRTCGVVAASSVYETEPVGGPAQDDFLNAVVLVPAASPGELLALARACETRASRERTVHWGPRTLDVDVIACGEIRSDDPEILLPHPRAHERAFVCVPWLEAAPDAVLPGHGPLVDLVATMRRDGAADGLRRTSFELRSGPTLRSGVSASNSPA